MAVHEHVIWRFIKEHGGRATKKQIFETFAGDEETRGFIEEKLGMMRSMGIVVIERDEVEIPEG